MECPKCGSEIVVIRRIRNNMIEYECLFCHNKWEGEK